MFSLSSVRNILNICQGNPQRDRPNSHRGGPGWNNRGGGRGRQRDHGLRRVPGDDDGLEVHPCGNF